MGSGFGVQDLGFWGFGFGFGVRYATTKTFRVLKYTIYNETKI